MDYKTEAPYDPQATAVKNLTTTIEALEYRLRLLRASAPAPSTDNTRAPPLRPKRSDLRLRSAPLPPKVSTGEDLAVLDAEENSMNDQAVEARWREESSRAHSKNRAPPVPEDVTTNIAMNAATGKNKEHVEVAPKLTIKIKPRMSLQDRFSVQIVAANNHTTLWDVGNSYSYSWAGMLVVQDAWPTLYTHVRDVIQDFAIDFRAIAEPITHPFKSSSLSLSPENDIWHTTYRHVRTDSNWGSPDPGQTGDIMVHSSYSREKSEEAGGPLTWRISFWVPVPAYLFARAESKTFVCQASVTVRHADRGAQQTISVRAEDIAVGIERLWTLQLCGTAPPALPSE